MIREAVSQLHWSVLPTVSMMLFLSVFIGVMIWAFRKGSGNIYAQMSQLPLEESLKGGEK